MDNVAVRKLWMPVTKIASGELVAILSDTSMDRDDELMSKELIESWATSDALPALADHKNSMETWVGGWKNRKIVRRNGHTALVATPMFFSKGANPLAARIKLQVEEALRMKLNPGISIGALPTDFEYVEIDEKEHRRWTKAELIEATWVPIQSNRNASFGHIAKSFNLNMKEESLMEDDIDKKKKEEKKDDSEEYKKMKENLDVKNAEVEALKKEIESLKEADGKGDNAKPDNEDDKDDDKKKSAMEELQKKVEALSGELAKSKEEFDKKLEAAVEKAAINLPKGPGTMDQDGQKKADADKADEKKFKSEDLFKSYIG